MRVQNQQIKWVSEGGTRRPEDTSRATAEERGTARSTLAGDDGSGSKPLVGSSFLEGPMMERNSTPLRKPINSHVERAWYVRWEGGNGGEGDGYKLLKFWEYLNHGGLDKADLHQTKEIQSSFQGKKVEGSEGVWDSS